MRVPKPAIGIIISMVLLSVFFANIFSLLSINALKPSEHTKQPFLQISDKFDKLIWVLQISDIHISIFRDPLRITEFREFAHYTIDAIKPSVVLASGDLTDAKTIDAIGSQQFEPEWKYYRDILKEYDITNKTLWLDIRGNHDNFNVADLKSKHNFFTNYSVQGREHPRSYMIQVRKGDILYSFIGIDACLEPGPRRPFNFVGILDKPEIEEINKIIKRSQESGSNYTIWFGHFPTSCILTTGNEGVRNLIKKDKNGFVYVCGHLHQLGGLVPRMYTMQNEGFLELELGDWKDNRMFRLLVIDHGMFSFLDIQHREWPVALVTNPKHALFFNPSKENLQNIKSSTHIRVLAFSLSQIKSVKIRLDGGPWITCSNVQGPLYVTTWNPLHYSTGLHKIEVYVKDADGREKTVNQPFSVDGTRLTFDILPRIALMSNASYVFRAFFVTTLVSYIVPLCLTRLIHKFVSDGRISRPKLNGNCLRNTLRKIWVLTTIDRLFWPVILYPVYLAFGPWSIGYIVEDHIGVIFSWGIFVNDAFLPGSFTYAYGFIQLVTFQIPLTFIMANAVDHRFLELVMKPGKKIPLKRKICLHLPFFIVFTIQVTMAYLFWLAYGTLAFILGPLRTWSLVLAGILYYLALNLPENCTRRGREICWSKSTSVDDINLSDVKTGKSS